MSIRRQNLFVASLIMAALPLAGCQDMKRALGMEKVIPDEFAVVSRAPLAIPPDYNLRPPRLGAPRTQETAPVDQARQAIFRAGDQQAALPPPTSERSAGETGLLRQAGAGNAPRDIRELVTEEASHSVPVEQSFVDKLLFWRGSDKLAPTDSVIDPTKEAQRLKERDTAGQAATASAATVGTPTIERKGDGPSFFERLENLF